MKRHLASKLHTKRAWWRREHEYLEKSPPEAHKIPCTFNCGQTDYQYFTSFLYLTLV